MRNCLWLRGRSRAWRPLPRAPRSATGCGTRLCFPHRRGQSFSRVKLGPPPRRRTNSWGPPPIGVCRRATRICHPRLPRASMPSFGARRQEFRAPQRTRRVPNRPIVNLLHFHRVYSYTTLPLCPPLPRPSRPTTHALPPTAPLPSPTAKRSTNAPCARTSRPTQGPAVRSAEVTPPSHTCTTSPPSRLRAAPTVPSPPHTHAPSMFAHARAESAVASSPTRVCAWCNLLPVPMALLPACACPPLLHLRHRCQPCPCRRHSPAHRALFLSMRVRPTKH